MVIKLVVVLLVVVVLSRHDCEIYANCEFVRITLVVGVVARAILVDLMFVEPVFWAAE